MNKKEEDGLANTIENSYFDPKRNAFSYVTFTYVRTSSKYKERLTIYNLHI